MSLENLADEFATLVAEKVVELLAKQQGSDWPATEKKGIMLPTDPPRYTTQEDHTYGTGHAKVVSLPNGDVSIGPFSANNLQGDDKVVTEPDEEKVVSPRTIDKLQAGTTKNPKQPRIDELSKVNVRTLRNQAAAVGVDDDNHDAEHYANNFTKEQLVNVIVDYEVLVGKTVDEIIDGELKDAGLKVGKSTKVESESEEVPDDTELVIPEPEDDEAPELTREVALGLDLADLKEIAIENDVDPAKLVGADVHAVVDLIFGPEETEVVEETEEESEDDDAPYTREQFEGMSLSELKGVIADLNKQLAEDNQGQIEMERGASEDDYVDAICEILEIES